MKLEHIWPPKPIKKYWFVDENWTYLALKTAWKVLICWWSWNTFDPQKHFKNNDFSENEFLIWNLKLFETVKIRLQRMRRFSDERGMILQNRKKSQNLVPDPVPGLNFRRAGTKRTRTRPGPLRAGTIWAPCRREGESVFFPVLLLLLLLLLCMYVCMSGVARDLTNLPISRVTRGMRGMGARRTRRFRTCPSKELIS